MHNAKATSKVVSAASTPPTSYVNEILVVTITASKTIYSYYSSLDLTTLVLSYSITDIHGGTGQSKAAVFGTLSTQMRATVCFYQHGGGSDTIIQYS